MGYRSSWTIGALRGYRSSWGHKESDMTERLYFYFILMRFLLYPLSEWKEKPLEEINGKQTKETIAKK